MKSLIIALLVIAAFASFAIAETGKNDPGHGNFQLDGRMTLTGALDTGTTFQRMDGGSPYGTTRYAPGCDLPMSQSFTANYMYASWDVCSSDTEPVGFEVTDFPQNDSVMALFCNFDPLNADSEIIGYNDDSSGGGLWSYIDPAGGVVMNPAYSYVLVVTTYSAVGADGPVEITTTDNVTGCTVATEATSWDSLKSLYR